MLNFGIIKEVFCSPIKSAKIKLLDTIYKIKFANNERQNAVSLHLCTEKP